MRRKVFAFMGIMSIFLSSFDVTAFAQSQVTKEYIVYNLEADFMPTVYSLVNEDVSEEEKLLQQAGVSVVEITEAEALEIAADGDYLVEENIWLEGNEDAEPDDSTIISAISSVSDSKWNINMVEAGNMTVSQNGAIKVAVIDSGVAVTEDIDIAERVNLVETEASSYLCEDMSGHGTAVASIIGAIDNEIGTTGVNSNLDIYSIKILDQNNKAPLSRVLAALSWCQENDIRVVNMSFGTETDSSILEAAVQKAADNGLLLIASAGNGDEVEYPAAYDSVIAVGSVDSMGVKSASSASGESLELVAPGECVPITAQLGYMAMGTGTSYAAPHVTAIAASLWNEVPEWSNEKVRALLSAGAMDIGESAEDYGNGLVNYEYTRSIMDEFSQTYVEVGSQVIENYECEEELNTYELPIEVEASWINQTSESNKGHYYLIEKGVNGEDTWQQAYGSKKVALLQEVSYWVDTDTYAKTVDSLHARDTTNYVATTRYLYEIALYQKNNPTQSISEVMSEVGNTSFYSFTDTEYTKVVHTILTLCSDDSFTTVTYSNNQAANNRAMRVLGLAMHVAGDAYAHKAMVPNTAEVRNNINNEPLTLPLTNRTNIMDKLVIDRLTTSGLCQNCEDATAASKIYSDNYNFLKPRYAYGAQHAVKRLMRDYYYKNAFNFTTFYHASNTIKQYNLLTYVKEANNGVEPGDTNWALISEDW